MKTEVNSIPYGNTWVQDGQRRRNNLICFLLSLKTLSLRSSAPPLWPGDFLLSGICRTHGVNHWGLNINLFTLLFRFSYLCLISPTKLKASRSQTITLNSLHSFLNILRHHNLFLKIILSVTQSEPLWLEEGWQDPNAIYSWLLGRTPARYVCCRVRQSKHWKSKGSIEWVSFYENICWQTQDLIIKYSWSMNNRGLNSSGPLIQIFFQ